MIILLYFLVKDGIISSMDITGTKQNILNMVENNEIIGSYPVNNQQKQSQKLFQWRKSEISIISK
jgi:hypothetical protein